jgi:hypothetical protein
MSLAKLAIKGGIRLIKGGAKSYGKIKKARSISKSGVESALNKGGVPRSLGKLKPKANAFKGVKSAGATKSAKATDTSGFLRVPSAAKKVAKTASKRMQKVNPYGAAAAVGAVGGIALQGRVQKAKSAKAAGSPAAVAPKKAAPKKKAPKKTATVKIAPYQAKSVVAKAKPRAASFTPTAKKTPTSVSAGKKKVGYVKSKRSLRRR